MKDRWVYGDKPIEVKGDPDALVCIVDVSRYFFGQYILCCQIKHLKEMFSHVKAREEAFERDEKVPPSPFLVDDAEYMDIIGGLMPEMWKKTGHEGNESDWECICIGGITKENFSECCMAYNNHKGLWCELDLEDNRKTSNPY